MNTWYFTEGNGLFMSTSSRDLFVAVQSNLTCPIANVRPVTLAARLARLADSDAERQLGCIGIRHISLLRTQLKADVNLNIGVNFYRKLRWIDRDLLRVVGFRRGGHHGGGASGAYAAGCPGACEPWDPSPTRAYAASAASPTIDGIADR